MWSVYDKEINYLSYGKLTDAELIKFVKYVAEYEIDRASFYEFENESGEKLDCWDINHRFELNIEAF